ncbi:MAG: peptidoglycan DD-metalloendopeptidase family protein [Roseiflexaceae bacterium]
MDRQRYLARRQQIEAQRRRRVMLGGCALAMGLIGLWWLWRGQADSVQAPAPVATVATAAATARPTDAAGPQPTAAAAPAEPAQPAPVTPAELALAPFFNDQRFVYEPDFYVPQIQAFLDEQPGPLKRMRFPVGDRAYSFAEVLVGQTSYYSLNPKVVLALLEAQSGVITAAQPSDDQMAWAVGFQGDNGNRRGLTAQIRWAVRQLFQARRSYPEYAPLTYADQSSAAPPAGMSMTEYAVARALAPTTSPDLLPAALARFQQTYTGLFGDPRPAPTGLPPPAQPFLSMPLERVSRVTSFFDHSGPLLGRTTGGLMTYWGRQETDAAFAYNGHDGWDYAAAPPDLALAAADGLVVFAGNADDNCATRAVVIDHGNGYRTLYWHLDRVDAQIGQTITRGQPVGVIGNSGCSLGPHLHLGVQYLGRSVDPYGWCGGDIRDFWAQHPLGSASTWLWVDRPSPCEPPPPGAALVDDGGPGFASSGGPWQTSPIGAGGQSSYVPSVRGVDAGRPWDLRALVTPSVAVYRPALPTAGRYRVLAYVPYAANGLDDAQRVRYRIRHSDGEAELIVSQERFANEWIDLGTFDFAPGQALVSLSNLAEEGQRGVWADAVIWLPAADLP